MKRLLILAMGLLLLSSLSLWTACSDDDEGTTNPTLTQGDTLDPNFIAFREGVDAADEVTGMMLDMIFNVADSVLHDAGNPNAKPLSIPTGLEVEADSIILTYHAASQYWYVYVGSMNEVDTQIVIDSVQFLHASGPVQWPDSALLTGVKSGMSMYWHMGNGIIDATQNVTILGDFPNLGMVTANGTQTASVTYADSHVELPEDTMACEFSLGFSTTYTNINFSLENMGECPAAGSLVHTGTAGIECSNETDTLTVGGTWTVTEEFTGTAINWTIENATTRWSGVDSCGNSIQRPAAIPPIFREVQ